MTKDPQAPDRAVASQPCHVVDNSPYVQILLRANLGQANGLRDEQVHWANPDAQSVLVALAVGLASHRQGPMVG